MNKFYQIKLETYPSYENNFIAKNYDEMLKIYNDLKHTNFKSAIVTVYQVNCKNEIDINFINDYENYITSEKKDLSKSEKLWNFLEFTELENMKLYFFKGNKNFKEEKKRSATSVINVLLKICKISIIAILILICPYILGIALLNGQCKKCK